MLSTRGRAWSSGKRQGGITCFGDIWIFVKFLIGLHRVLSILLFSIWTAHIIIMYWNMMILNPSRFKVEPHWKYWYFCIERVDLLLLRFSEDAVLFHIEWVCRKTAGNVNRSPYRFHIVTPRWLSMSSVVWKKGRTVTRPSISDDGGHDRPWPQNNLFSHSPIPRDLHCAAYRQSVTRFTHV